MSTAADGSGGEWFTETIHEDCQQRLRITRTLYESRTGLQDIVIFENPLFGRVLALDGIIQTTERDECCYHEMLAHVPLLAHGDAREVAIIGGGDGGALREVLKHDSVRRATMVEIDGGVVDICREYLPGLSDGAFDDPRTDLVIADGVRFVAETERRFDVIIVDSTDPVGPAVALFSDGFYRDCRRILTGDGVVVCQSGNSFPQREEARDTYRRLRDIFADASLYVTDVPTYGFGYMTLGWGAASARARTTPVETVRARFEAASVATRYYHPGIHPACFEIPVYMEELKG